ncbi:MAG: hypothetical protein H0T79_13920 [Deltaproteobacteria bacterium]|nr:hypothetical protein [Deltaproteobacteria bacterium]
MRCVLVIIAMLVGCAHDVRARFPARPEESTSSIVLLLSDAANGVSVAVNGILVVEGEHTSRIVIDGVPVGAAEIVMAANGSEKAMRVAVSSEHATTIPLGVPDGGGPAGFLKTVMTSLITILVYALVN